jgi:hypothetical protein
MSEQEPEAPARFPGSVNVAYVLPISGNGRVELHINARLDLDEHDREFILAVLDKVGEFARLVHPPAKSPEIPAVLRGIGGRP